MSSHFCTCNKTDCELHPSRHDKGCSPCISKNLKSREIPSCYFNLLEGSEQRSGDGFADFAALIQKNTPQEGK